jgi:hypothetical protein
MFLFLDRMHLELVLFILPCSCLMPSYCYLRSELIVIVVSCVSKLVFRFIDQLELRCHVSLVSL